MLIKVKRLLVALTLLTVIKSISSAPKTWPYMKTYDIWDTNKPVADSKDRSLLVDYSRNFIENDSSRNSSLTISRRRAKGES